MGKQPAARDVRVRVRRVARSQPQLAAGAVARIVGCHPATASKYLRDVPAWAGAKLPRCGHATLQGRNADARHRRQTPAGRRLPESVLGRLAADSDRRTRARLVQRSLSPLPDRLMSRLAFDIEHEVRTGVASRVEHRGLVAMLARDRHWVTRHAAAANPACPAQTLGILAGDPSPDVRLAVSRHTGCPPDALATLAADTEPHVRSSVAAHQSAPAAALRLLAGDPDAEAQAAVSAHRNTPPDTAARIAGDVSAAGSTRCAAARHPNCDPATLERIAGNDDGYVRAAAAENPNCEPALVARLAVDPDWAVRQSVAWRADLAPELAALLTADPQRGVRLAAVRNPNCPTDTLAAVSRTDISDEVKGAASRASMSRRRARKIRPTGQRPPRRPAAIPESCQQPATAVPRAPLGSEHARPEI